MKHKLRIKEGVSLIGLKMEMRNVLIEASHIWYLYGQELVVTSGTEGEHSPGSLHYYGYAVDLRTHYFQKHHIKNIAEDLTERLGPDYDVVITDTHMHVEYDPAAELMES